MIEGIDTKISDYKNIPKKYRFSETSIEKVNGAKEDYSFHINKIHIINCTFLIHTSGKIGSVSFPPLEDVLCIGSSSTLSYPIVIKKNGDIVLLNSANESTKISIYTQYIV